MGGSERRYPMSYSSAPSSRAARRAPPPIYTTTSAAWRPDRAPSVWRRGMNGFPPWRSSGDGGVALARVPAEPQAVRVRGLSDSSPRSNASEFITHMLEDKYDQIAKRDNYVSYIARRLEHLAGKLKNLSGKKQLRLPKSAAEVCRRRDCEGASKERACGAGI